jgi:hypothetical protein
VDEQVKKYLESLPSPQKEICERLRKIILDTAPGIDESFKNGVPWYECKYYLVAFNDHVNIGFSVEGLTKEQMGLFEGNGKYMRHIKIYSIDAIDEKKIARLLKVVMQGSNSCE